MVSWESHSSVRAICIFSSKRNKLQQPFQCTVVGIFSPARIPLECWEAPTKAPFTGGAAEEEPVQVKRRRKGDFHPQ